MNRISRLTALLLAVLLFLGSVTAAAEGLQIGGASGLTIEDWEQLVNSAEGSLFYTEEGDTGKEVIPESPELPEQSAYYPYTGATELTLTQGDTAAEAYITASEVAVLTCADAGQWQIDRGEGFVSLKGATGTTLNVSAAMVGGDSASFRKGLGAKDAQTGEYAAYTQTAVVSVIESAAVYSLSREAESTENDGIMTLEAANQENMIIVEVAYVIAGTDQPVADSYVGQIARKSTLSTTLTLPKVTGYLAADYIPYEGSTTVTFTAQTADAAGAITLNVTAAESVADITIRVQYEPTNVNFTVRHFQQNVENDGYTEVAADKQTLQGLTGAPVGEGLQKTYEGFQHIWYDPTTAIAADGSTVVEIYYNREYYMMTFDLGGGYGVDPIFARYGATIAISVPQRAGYTFAGWVDADGNAATIPATMPLTDSKYTATWTAADTTFVVAYWLENPNDDGYSYWGAYKENAKAETVVDGETYQNYPDSVGDTLDEYEKRYSYYSHADADVTVSGDGDTVVNVYYKRKAYTLKFYYAQEGDGKYYVIGGSTYRFGYHAQNTVNKADEVSLLSYYMSEYTSERGEVASKPTLNARGTARGYASGSDAATVGEVEYLYHYIAFSAKYGADISELWPCDVFDSVKSYDTTSGDWAGDQAYVSAWNGEHHVYYSQNNSNQTIKGNYTELDYQLLWASRYDDPSDMTVTYLCFWENGASVNWNIPELYRYHIWVPVLENQDLTNENLLVWNGVTYYEKNVYDTFDNSIPHDQTPSAITGFTCINSNTAEWYDYETASENKKTWTGENAKDPNGHWQWITIPDEHAGTVRYAYDINWFYTRNTYSLTFESYSDNHTVADIPFGSDLSEQAWEPPYPTGQEEGALKFVGWYTSPECIAGTEFDFDTTTMPAHDVGLFAKWELVKHKVQFWLDSTMTVEVVDYPAVTHGQTITNVYQDASDYVDPDEWLESNTDHAYSKYAFDGWYYIDENGDEMRFDIDTMPITGDMDIYAKWTSNDPVPFTFKFYHEDGTQLAPDYTGQALPNTPVTLSAKIGDELTLAPKQDNLLGYIPYVNSHTIVLDVDETKNVYTFVYQEPAEVSYTVQYLVADWVTDDNGNQVLAPVVNTDGSYTHLVDEKTETTKKAVVTENYVPVVGYMPHATQLRLIVGMDESLNVLQFLYAENEKDAPYSVTHYVTDHAGVTTIARSETNLTGTIDATVSVEKLSLTGYAFAYAKVAVPTQNDGTWTDVLHDPTATDPTVQYVLPQAGMHVYLYYEPVKYPFKVQYINAATDGLIDTKLATEAEYKEYGSTLSTADYVIDIEDYRFVRFDPATWTVDVETNFNDPAVNVLSIYYDLDVADIAITKEIAVSQEENAPKPTEDELNTAFEFTVTLTNASKEQANAYVTVDDVTQTTTVTNGTLTFKLTNGQTAVIHDLWVGTQYTIVEKETDIFKTSYVGDAAGTLTALGAEVTVINTFPKYSGELIVVKNGLKETKESAIVHVDVGGVDYYLVLNASNGYTATITGIKPGTAYTVSEVTAWTWQYTSATGSTSGTITETDIRQTVTITNTYNGDKWMHDESHVSNDFGTAASTGVNQ